MTSYLRIEARIEIPYEELLRIRGYFEEYDAASRAPWSQRVINSMRSDILAKQEGLIHSILRRLDPTCITDWDTESD